MHNPRTIFSWYCYVYRTNLGHLETSDSWNQNWKSLRVAAATSSSQRGEFPQPSISLWCKQPSWVHRIFESDMRAERGATTFLRCCRTMRLREQKTKSALSNRQIDGCNCDLNAPAPSGVQSSPTLCVSCLDVCWKSGCRDASYWKESGRRSPRLRCASAANQAIPGIEATSPNWYQQDRKILV